MKKLITITGMAALATILAACGPSASTTPVATTPAAAPSVTATTAATPAATATTAAAAAATATATPSSLPAGTPSSAVAVAAAPAALWCGNVAAASPVSPLSAWLGSDGYQAVQGIEGTLANLRAPNVPAATIQAESASLCSGVAESEASPPPADLADYTTAMNDFVTGSHLLHGGTAAAQAAASPDISAGTAAFDSFLAAIGKPAQG